VRLAQGPRLLAYLGYAYAMVGRSEDAQRLLSSLTQLSEQQYATPVGIAAVHLALGEKEQALVWLEKAYQAHDSDLTGIATDPRLRALHSDGHFQDLLRRVGLAR
jgi:Flp pilus assembly protein TadD